MLSIIDNFSNRTIRILKILSEKNNWITIKELSERLEVSEKTVQENLKFIREELGDKIRLESSNIRGIRAVDFPINSFLEVQSLLLINSTTIKLVLELLKNPYHDLYYYSEKLHVSRSTLYREIPIINEFFSKYEVQIKRQRSLYYISGNDEYTCRRFFTTFIFELYEYKTQPFIPNKLAEFYKNRITRIYEENNEVISDIQLAYYSVFYHFSIIREQSLFYLNNLPFFKGVTSEFNSEDKQFLMNIKNIPTIDSFQLTEKTICIHRHTMFSKTDRLYIKESTNFVNTIYNTFNINKNDDNIILIDYLTDLCINVKYFKIPYHFFNDRFSSFAKQIESDHLLVHKTLINLIKTFSKKVNLDFSIYENHLIYLFVVTIPNILQSTVNKPLLFVSSYSEEHSKFMANMVQRQLGLSNSYVKNNKNIYYEDLFTLNLAEYQVIISNLDIENIEHPFVLINDFPTKKDILNIKEQLS